MKRRSSPSPQGQLLNLLLAASTASGLGACGGPSEPTGDVEAAVLNPNGPDLQTRTIRMPRAPMGFFDLEVEVCNFGPGFAPNCFVDVRQGPCPRPPLLKP